MRKIIIIVSVLGAVVFLVTGLILGAVKAGIPKELYEYKSSDNWGAEAHSHIAAYMSSDAGFSYESMMMVKYGLESDYKVDSIDTSYSRYSASGEKRITLVPMSGPRTSNCEAIIYAGDYFTFHKPKLLEGAYPMVDAVHTDSILIDELAAWQIFGTKSNVVGLEVNFDGYTYIVCGVVEVPKGIYTEVYGDRARVYVSSESTALRGKRNVFTTFEAMIPDPISNYAHTAVKEGLSSYSPEVIDIDKRFSGKELEKLRDSRTKLLIGANEIEYSFNEKAMLLLSHKAADVHVWMKTMYYISLSFAVILFFAVYGPVVRFIGKLLKKLKF